MDIEKIDEAIAEALGDAYDCTRVWSAWGRGTMGPDDFTEVREQPDRIAEIREAALGPVREELERLNSENAALIENCNLVRKNLTEARAALEKSQAEAAMYWNEIVAMDKALSDGDRDSALLRIRNASTLKPLARLELGRRLKAERARCAAESRKVSLRDDDMGAIIARLIEALGDEA